LPAVIEVPVREDDRIHLRRALRQILVDPPRLVARPLVHPEIEEHPQPVDLEQVTRPRDGAVGAAELNAHRGKVMRMTHADNASNPSRARTCNLRLRRPLRFQLSYG